MADLSGEIRDVLAEHQERMNRVVERGGVAPMRRLYDEAIAELERKLFSAISPGNVFTAHQQRILLLQVKQAAVDLSRRMADELSVSGEEVQREAIRGLIRDIARLEETFTGASISLPIEEAARFRGLIDKNRSSLLRMYQTSSVRLNSRIVSDIEQQLSLSLVSGESNGDAIKRVMDVYDTNWYGAERIVRTELSWAGNATHRDAIIEAAPAVPGLMMRWVEHVDDNTGRPLDDRVGVDSIAIHGQVTPANGVFTMPSSAPHSDAKGNTQVPIQLVGKSWSHPPNRPNDRSVVQPWRKEWGIPGWFWRGGHRVAA